MWLDRKSMYLCLINLCMQKLSAKQNKAALPISEARIRIFLRVYLRARFELSYSIKSWSQAAEPPALEEDCVHSSGELGHCDDDGESSFR